MFKQIRVSTNGIISAMLAAGLMLCSQNPAASESMTGDIIMATEKAHEDEKKATTSSASGEVSARASASATASSSASGSTRDGCNATAASSAKATSGDKHVYDTDRDSTQKDSGDCSAEASSRAGASVEKPQQ